MPTGRMRMVTFAWLGPLCVLSSVLITGVVRHDCKKKSGMSRFAAASFVRQQPAICNVEKTMQQGAMAQLASAATRSTRATLVWVCPAPWLSSCFVAIERRNSEMNSIDTSRWWFVCMPAAGRWWLVHLHCARWLFKSLLQTLNHHGHTL